MTQLDPNDIVRNYPGFRRYDEMLQDLIAMYDKLLKYNSTDSLAMTALLFPAVYTATQQLELQSDNAGFRMVGGRHGGTPPIGDHKHEGN